MLKHKKSKHPYCVPTHLTEEEALHIEQQAFERGWSNSAYLRSLVIADMSRMADDLHLRACVLGINSEQLKLFKHCERKERKRKK